MNARSFFASIPRLCKAPNASRWGRLNELQYDEELCDPHSVFKRNAKDMEYPANRLETAFGFKGDESRMSHCRALAELMILCHYANKHGEKEWGNRIAELESVARAYEPMHPDIAAEMSVETAMAGEWNP